MQPVLDLAPGAELNPLAVDLFSRIAAAIEASRAQAALFRKLKGSIAVVAFDEAAAATLRFDNGRLTVHDGVLGVPGVTIRLNREILLDLLNIRTSATSSSSFAWLSRDARARLSRMRQAMQDGQLQVFGFPWHPFLVLGIFRLLSSHPT